MEIVLLLMLRGPEAAARRLGETRAIRGVM